MSDKNAHACTFPDCTEPAVCNGPNYKAPLCRKHYMQDRRGRLGVTKEIAPPGEGDEITIRVPKALKAEMGRVAKAEKLDAADVWREAAREYLARREAGK